MYPIVLPSTRYKLYRGYFFRLLHILTSPHSRNIYPYRCSRSGNRLEWGTAIKILGDIRARIRGGADVEDEKAKMVGGFVWNLLVAYCVW